MRGMSDCQLPEFFNEPLFLCCIYTQGSLYSCKMPIKPIGELIKEIDSIRGIKKGRYTTSPFRIIDKRFIILDFYRFDLTD